MENEMNNYQGIIDDPRTEEAKEQDYKHADVFATNVNWVKKELKDCKKYTPREQNGSLSCCGQGSAKGVETLVGKMMSATPPYRYRSNFPDGGMWTQDIGAVWKKYGSCLETELNSQSMHESEMNAMGITVPTPYKIGGYIQPNSKNIEEIAQAIETYGHCMLIFHANGNEWNTKPVYNGLQVNFGHCVTGVDYFLDENGVKCILIEDSASRRTSINGMGQRIITEDYLKQRCSSAIYFTSVNPLEMPYKFTKVLKIGSRGFDVKKLQEKLNIAQDGIFGKNTKQAVINYQKTNRLVPDGIVGSKTNAVLNK